MMQFSILESMFDRKDHLFSCQRIASLQYQLPTQFKQAYLSKNFH